MVKKRVRAIEELLLKGTTGRKKRRRDADPVDTLIRTILSQNTNNGLRDRAYASLIKRFPDHESIAAADTEEIAQAIKIAGLSGQKSKTIKRALNELRNDGGEISLDFLNRMRTDDAISRLMNVKGIGDKTAAIVMLFCFDRRTFPVDTHIQRITKRIGLVPASYSPEKIRRLIEPHISPSLAADLHRGLISLGKNVCHSAKPSCPACPLVSLCAFGKLRRGESE